MPQAGSSRYPDELRRKDASMEPARARSRPAEGAGGRRTVTVRGYGAEGAPVQRRRPATKRYQREGFRPDRIAMWAVLMGVLLVLVCVASSHAAVRIAAPAAGPAATAHAAQ